MTETSHDPAADRGSDLIERYLAAVGRDLPAGQREDVARELRASVLDSIEDRMAADLSIDRESAAREVLIELGDPAVLARAYVAGPGHLIGPAVYSEWRATLRNLVVIVVPLVTAIAVVAGVWADNQSVGHSIGEGVWAGAMTVVHVAFWVTLVFWILERTGTGLGDRSPWSVDSLPDAPRKREISRADAVWAAGLMVTLIGWLAWQHHRSPIAIDGERVPMLTPDLWANGWLWGLVGLAVLAVLVAVVSFRIGVWSVGVTIASILVDLAFAAFAVAVVASRQFVNPEAFSRVDDPASVAADVDLAVLVLMVLIAVFGIGDAVRRHLQHRIDQAVAHL